jgi:aspartate aminotransferase
MIRYVAGTCSAAISPTVRMSASVKRYITGKMTGGVMRISERLRSLPMSGIRKMFDLAGPESVNLGLGEPDLSPPKEAVEGICDAVRKGLNRYGPTAGIPELRQAVAERHDLSHRNIMITQSGTSALYLAASSFLDSGDETLIPDPGFVVYGPHSLAAGAKVTGYGLTDDLIPDTDDICGRITKRTKVIFVNSPSNPTGGVIDRKTFKAICDIASDNDITIISDEVYEPFIYEGEHLSFTQELDKAVVINGFSKMMAVTGWRMGYIAASEDIIGDLTKMNYHMTASPNMPAQYGILSAMPSVDAYLDNARSVFRKRRDLIVGRLERIDRISIRRPRGAFYAFPRIDTKMPSEETAMELARNGLICTPGSAFGERGEGHLRFSYAADETKINRGMDILEDVTGRMV